MSALKKIIRRGVVDRTRGDSLPGFHQDVTPFLEHLKEVEQSWNDSFRDFGLKIEWRSPTPDEFALQGNINVSNWLDGDKRGSIYPNQIRAAANVIREAIEHPGNSGTVIGATMSGKTGTSHACFILPVVLSLLQEKIYQSVILLPPQKGIEEQSRLAFSRYKDFYGNACISHTSSGRRSGLNVILKNWVRSIPQTLDIFTDGAGVDSISPMVKRTAGKIQYKWNKMLEAASEKNVNLVLLGDELDYGCKKDGVFGKMISFLDEKKIADNRFSRSFFVGFSATPYPLMGIKSVWQVRQPLSPGYCGFNMFGGSPIDPNLNIPTPECMSFHKFSIQYKVPFFSNLMASAYLDEKKFIKEKEKHVCAKENRRNLRGQRDFSNLEWHAYRKKFERSIVDAIHIGLLQERRGLGGCIRLTNTNNETDNFLEKIK